MPIEIKELSIKINAGDGGGSAPAASSGGASQPSQAGNMTEPDPALIAACVERVLEALRRKEER